jgi:hypothetical protein
MNSQIPEEPGRPPSDEAITERQVDLRAMAEAVREASEALRRFTDLARLTNHRLDDRLADLEQVAEDCRGWALGFAYGTGAI